MYFIFFLSSKSLKVNLLIFPTDAISVFIDLSHTVIIYIRIANTTHLLFCHRSCSYIYYTKFHYITVDIKFVFITFISIKKCRYCLSFPFTKVYIIIVMNKIIVDMRNLQLKLIIVSKRDINFKFKHTLSICSTFK